MCALCTGYQRGIHCEVTQSAVIDPVKTCRFCLMFIRQNKAKMWSICSPKNPKSPVCMTAWAFASLARSLSADRRPRMSATQRIRPWMVSSIFVWVFTCCADDGAGREEIAE